MRDVRQESPECLFQRFREQADPEAFRLVVELTARRLVRRAQRLGISSADVDDVVQETYLAALLNAATFDASRHFVRWLAGILAKKVLDARRQTVRHRPAPDALHAEQPEGPVDDLETRELRRALDLAMLAVPNRYREILQLRFEQGMNAEQIGQDLGIPSSTVRTQISRGLEHLRRVLRSYGYPDPRASHVAR